MSLTKAQILAADDLAREEIEVPEWGGTVWVRMLTGAEMMTVLNSQADSYQANMLAACLCDESGARLFSAEEAGEAMGKSYEVLSRLLEAARRLNNFNREAAEKN